jgi:alkylation response protein AidB-like acyl-CoA dehydrogenase
VDLQLTDEQRWLSESVGELVSRAPEDQLWRDLVEFGAFDESLGAVELALIARGLGTGLAAVPFVETAAVRYAAPLGDRESASPCLSEPETTFAPARPGTSLDDDRVSGEKSTVAYAAVVDVLAVPAAGTDRLALALVPSRADGVAIELERSLEPSLQTAAVRFDSVAVDRVVAEPGVVERLAAAAGLLAAAESVGAAAEVLELARDYAAQRRQFGHTIGSFQAVRHLLADMYVKVESSWSSVLYAAASLDEDEPDALRTASIAKAYTARATHDTAHHALQVFGGIAFTAEHAAHRFLRRIVARGGQYGTAAEHERRLGHALAQRVEVPA